MHLSLLVFLVFSRTFFPTLKLLIVGNVLIVVGGSLLAGGSDDVNTNWNDNPDLTTAKALRGTGQCIFLAEMLVIAAFIIVTWSHSRQSTAAATMRDHSTELLVLVLTLPFLIIRGCFGVAQAFDDSLNVSRRHREGIHTVLLLPARICETDSVCAFFPLSPAFDHSNTHSITAHPHTMIRGSARSL